MAATAGPAMKPMAAIVGVALAGLSAFAQDRPPTFRSRVEAVRVDVSVMDGAAAVPGLAAANFEILDNGVPQRINGLSVDAAPLSLMLVLDTSGSLAGERLTHLIDAVRGLVQSLKPDDQAALITFSEPVHLATPMTRDRDPLLKALGSLKADGATSLNDAVFLAFQLRPVESADSRPVVLVFSDGRDTASWLSSAQILEATRRSGVVTHVVELMQDSWTGLAAGGTVKRRSAFLGELASAGGGRQWSAESSRDLRKLFAKVLNELRSRYLLTYYPTGTSREGWHDVTVTLKGARGEVTAKPGYFVSASP